MTMFLLIIFTAFCQEIFSSKGQPMSPYVINVPPLVSEPLRGMILPSIPGSQNLELCPVGNPLLTIPCEVPLTYISKPHWHEKMNVKCKMATPKRLPSDLCVEKLKPKNMIGSISTSSRPKKGATESYNRTTDFDTGKVQHQNVTHNLVGNSSSTGTENKTAMQKPQSQYENNSEQNQTSSNPETVNITRRPRIKIRCLPPSLVALDCLARLQATNLTNSTANGRVCMKKADMRCGPIDYMTVEASIYKHSNSSEIYIELSRAQMRALENCLAGDNGPVPYLINGHPLTVTLQYADHSEKQHILTCKMGHDFLIAIPPEVGQGANKQPPIIDESDNKSTCMPDCDSDQSTQNEMDWLSLFDKTILCSGKINVKERETLNESEVNQTSNDLPQKINALSRLENGNPADDWTDEESYDENKESRYQLINQQTLPQDQLSYYNTMNCPTLLPIMRQYYSKPNTVYLMADHFPRLNHGYPSKEPVLIERPFPAQSAKPFPAQSARFSYGREIQGSSEDIYHENYCPKFIETLGHDNRLNPTEIIRQNLPNVEENGAEILHEPNEMRKNVKYEKCRRIETIEQTNGIQSRPEMNKCWEREVPIRSFISNPQQFESLNGDHESESWSENYCPNVSQIQPKHYVMSQNPKLWKRLPIMIQPSLVPFPRQVCLYKPANLPPMLPHMIPKPL